MASGSVSHINYGLNGSTTRILTQYDVVDLPATKFNVKKMMEDIQQIEKRLAAAAKILSDQ